MGVRSWLVALIGVLSAGVSSPAMAQTFGSCQNVSYLQSFNLRGCTSILGPAARTIPRIRLISFAEAAAHLAADASV